MITSNRVSVAARIARCAGLGFHGTAVIALAGVVLLLAGCGRGDGGPERFHVSGAVLFDGSPVPIGRIVFEPDTSKGNDGPPGYVEIKNGRYDTRNGGKGTVGGPHIVVIEGFDDELITEYVEDAEEEMMRPKRLFRGYRTEIELDGAAASVDFDVPASAGEADQ